MQMERVVLSANSFWRPTSRLTEGIKRADQTGVSGGGGGLVGFAWLSSYRK